MKRLRYHWPAIAFFVALSVACEVRRPLPLGPSSGPAPNLAGTRGSVAASPDLAVLIPVDVIPPTYREVGRGPALLPATDGEAPASLLVTLEQGDGSRITLTFVRVERPPLARNLLAFLGQRYLSRQSCAGGDFCVWQAVAPASVGDVARSYAASPEAGVASADLFVRRTVVVGVELETLKGSPQPLLRERLLAAIDDRITELHPD